MRWLHWAIPDNLEGRLFSFNLMDLCYHTAAPESDPLFLVLFPEVARDSEPLDDSSIRGMEKP
jgi:hypothetical protein